MKHELVELHLSEWFAGGMGRSPKEAILEFIRFMTDRDYRSFELELSTLLSDFLGHTSDQSSITDDEDRPSVFTSCLKKNNALVFVDVESGSEEEEYVMELDIFAPDKASLISSKQELIEDVMKCFGLTKSKEALIHCPSTITLPKLRERLQAEAAISDALFQQLKDDEERAILLELKKRGAVLERDFTSCNCPLCQSESQEYWITSLGTSFDW